MEERQTGVAEETLVHASQGKRPAHVLAPRDRVWSFDCESRQWRLTSIRRQTVQSVKADMSHLQVDDSYLRLGCSQLVWAEGQATVRQSTEGEGRPASKAGSWVEAKNLIPGDRVLSIAGPLLVERNVIVEGEAVNLVELETGSLHNYAVGLFGALVHNRVPALAAGQTHLLTVQASGVQLQLTLPPIDLHHIFRGLFDPTIPVLHGLHHLAGQHAIQQSVPIVVTGHTVLTPGPGGGQVPRTVTIRVIPALSVTGDAPFAARVEVIDPGTNTVLATKKNSTFFPSNWTVAQVIQAIYEAACNSVVASGILPVGNGFQARTDGGVAMLLHVAANAAGSPTLIRSGYPHGPQPLVTAAQAPQ